MVKRQTDSSTNTEQRESASGLAGRLVGDVRRRAEPERSHSVACNLLEADPALVAERPGQTVIADKHYYGRDFEHALRTAGMVLMRQARKDEAARPGARLFTPLRQTIESINQTFKGQLELERHGGRTPAEVIARVLQRILALTAAMWTTTRPTSRPNAH
ncbi:hypothetical protein GCM10022267_88430 [Lentzea roselyniae]|uniref:Transposase DDE domain-containing protein n=1 Tax=Lentzea roselyniae TaxID=531940 RepID=A0ABP7CGA0_9PSEU